MTIQENNEKNSSTENSKFSKKRFTRQEKKKFLILGITVFILGALFALTKILPQDSL